VGEKMEVNILYFHRITKRKTSWATTEQIDPWPDPLDRLLASPPPRLSSLSRAKAGKDVATMVRECSHLS
jgi:hypothetical protein